MGLGLSMVAMGIGFGGAGRTILTTPQGEHCEGCRLIRARVLAGHGSVGLADAASSPAAALGAAARATAALPPAT